ncbi:glutamate-cysteine ligase family protein [Crateriforma conspicua]|uniref:Carboxylate-amine ligase YbdK n=1 Tax=Crateriforma conspicua TaxID=2527996 RepID=A0A5C6FQA3_9PLAN|nr:glutamate-cysteine ligase family protein [Crateriforma conspicua]TWU62758.1 Carboxylate-amine ligase YbdK [Crateriforma conspicua]
MTLQIFEAYGIELEYMLVDASTLDVRPMADTVLGMLNGGQITGDVVRGPVTWSNELAMHVLELKVGTPNIRLATLAGQFEQAIIEIREVLERCHLRLLPTAMHPWMDPRRDVVLWPHDCYEIYQGYDQIFGCRSHGWGNVQSVHLNVPFDGDEQFRRLHAAVRLVIPVLSALTASSPIIGGQDTGIADNRMQQYCRHCDLMPALAGSVVPETVRSEAEYEQMIFQPIREAISKSKSASVMDPQFLNARGAIARFDRGSIEIRVMDVQEYPGADVAVCAAIIAVLRLLVDEKWSSLEEQEQVATSRLRSVLDRVTVDAEMAVIDAPEYLRCFAVDAPSIRVSDLWNHLLEVARREDSMVDNLFAPLEIILRDGTLSTRIRAAIDGDADPANLQNVYEQVADCLDRWEPFQP